jgi:hypothetical protein
VSANHVAPGAQQKRFAAYLNRLAHAAGHADRTLPLKSYFRRRPVPAGGPEGKAGLFQRLTKTDWKPRTAASTNRAETANEKKRLRPQ